jgi:hypothetical protein
LETCPHLTAPARLTTRSRKDPTRRPRGRTESRENGYLPELQCRPTQHHQCDNHSPIGKHR